MSLLTRILGTEPYTAKLMIWGRTFEATGATALEAIKKLDIKNPKGKSILIVTVGDKKQEKVLTPFFTHRLFGSRGLTREVSLKNVGLLFDL